MGSLRDLTQIDHAKSDTMRFQFNRGEFHDEAIARGTAIQEYLSRVELPSDLSW